MNTDIIQRLKIQHYIVLSLMIILATLVFYPSSVSAEGIFIPAASRVDMVYDSTRDVVYITNGDSVLRYHLTSATFLSPFQLGGSLSGIDLSPDGNTLVVADRQRSGTQVWIHLVDLNTEQSRQVFFPRAFYEGGTFTAVYANDGTIFITSRFEGSGWVPMRRYDPVNDTTTIIASVRQDTMLAASADGNTIAFAESNISDGSWGIYDVTTEALTRRTGYTNGTGWFNYEIGVNRTGTQYAIPTYGGTYIYDSTFSHTSTLGQYAGQQPIGVVYHPTKDIVYFAWSGTNQVRGHDTTTLAEVESYDFEYTFGHTGNHAFTQGRLKIARDGKYLLGTVGGGVRVVQIGGDLSDLSVTKRVIPTNPVAPGTPITYTLAFSNAGNSLANDVLLTDIVPFTLTNISVTHSGAVITDTGLNPGFTWDVEDLAPLLGGLITITGRIRSDLTTDTIFTNTATITSSTPDLEIANNQAVAIVEVVLPALSISDATLLEGTTGTVNAIFTVTLSTPGTAPVTVNYTTIDNSATVTDNDYIAASGIITFAPGDVTHTIPITINGDTTIETDEIFYVNLSGAIGAAMVDNQGVGTIINDDTAVSISNAMVNEGNTGTQNAVFDVTLSVPIPQPLTVSFATADGTATTADKDYTAANGIVTFPSGSSREAVSVTIISDAKVEPDETFYVNLARASSATKVGANATIADGQGLGTIINDDVWQAPLPTPDGDDNDDEEEKEEEEDHEESNTTPLPTPSVPVPTVTPLPVLYLPETGLYSTSNIPAWPIIVVLSLGVLAVGVIIRYWR
jgi:uncharacterized repeat protein (TIGR01451 family)